MARSIQEEFFPTFTCYGCGQANPDGMHLRSYVDDHEVVGEHTVAGRFENGMGFANGGVVSMLLDCHAGAVMWHGVNERGWDVDGKAWWVTSGFEIQFRRPTPLEVPLRLSGHVIEASPTDMTIATSLSHDGRDRATMTSSWKPFRPR